MAEGSQASVAHVYNPKLFKRQKSGTSIKASNREKVQETPISKKRLEEWLKK
jgi:hypothetical protein